MIVIGWVIVFAVLLFTDPNGKWGNVVTAFSVIAALVLTYLSF